MVLVLCVVGICLLLADYGRKSHMAAEFKDGEYLCKDSGIIKYSHELHMEQIEESLKKGGA